MVSKEELEDILLKEEVEKIWKSIDTKAIKRAEADEKYWKEVLDPFYDEMSPHTPAKTVSDVVRKEIEEYKESDPIFAVFDDIESYGTIILASIGLFYYVIGMIFLIYFFYLGEVRTESCLSC